MHPTDQTNSNNQVEKDVIQDLQRFFSSVKDAGMIFDGIAYTLLKLKHYSGNSFYCKKEIAEKLNTFVFLEINALGEPEYPDTSMYLGDGKVLVINEGSSIYDKIVEGRLYFPDGKVVEGTFELTRINSFKTNESKTKISVIENNSYSVTVESSEATYEGTLNNDFSFKKGTSTQKDANSYNFLKIYGNTDEDGTPIDDYYNIRTTDKVVIGFLKDLNSMKGEIQYNRPYPIVNSQEVTKFAGAFDKSHNPFEGNYTTVSKEKIKVIAGAAVGNYKSQFPARLTRIS